MFNYPNMYEHKNVPFFNEYYKSGAKSRKSVLITAELCKKIDVPCFYSERLKLKKNFC